MCNLFFKITQLLVLYHKDVVSKKNNLNLDLITKLFTLRFLRKKFLGLVSLIDVFIKLPTLATLSLYTWNKRTKKTPVLSLGIKDDNFCNILQVTIQFNLLLTIGLAPITLRTGF